MNKQSIFFITLFLYSFGSIVNAQSSVELKNVKTPARNFPELLYTKIPNAPKLSSPQLLIGETKPILSEGMGWAAASVYDWNGDGKKDLLIGEFGSGLENEGHVVGHFIRVYKNIGTDEDPKFSDDFEYARPETFTGNGTPLSISTWCCSAFRPSFVDLNDDGYLDIVAGEYFPGDVVWFKGGKDGFCPGEKLKQEGRDRHPRYGNNLPITDPGSHRYWNYTSVSFGDFTGNGLFDMIVGGSALRISRNIGIKTEPAYGLRELLLDINGKPLRIYEYTEAEVKEFESNYGFDPNIKSPAGSPVVVPLVVDWDQDGVLDLLVTDSYDKKGKNAVSFFRGVKTKNGHRFHPAVPLFIAKEGGKAFPGSWLRVSVTDWNNDGVNDLLIGSSVAILNGEFNNELSWSWEQETGISKKNPGYYSESQIKRIKDEMTAIEKRETEMGREAMIEKGYRTKEGVIKEYYVKEDYKTLVHKGYVYLMLGKRN